MDEMGCQKSAAYSAIDAALGKTVQLNLAKLIEAIPEADAPTAQSEPEA